MVGAEFTVGTGLAWTWLLRVESGREPVQAVEPSREWARLQLYSYSSVGSGAPSRISELKHARPDAVELEGGSEGLRRAEERGPSEMCSDWGFLQPGLTFYLFVPRSCPWCESIAGSVMLKLYPLGSLTRSDYMRRLHGIICSLIDLSNTEGRR